MSRTLSTAATIPGVSTRSRMLFKGHVYQVTSVINLDERDREMELVADLQELTWRPS